MKQKGRLSATIIAGLLLLAGTSRAEVICGKVPPLKPVRCMCGKLIDVSGGPVAGATVRIIKDGAELASLNTAADGKFFFRELKPGSYELEAAFDGFKTFRSPIVLAGPAKKCRRGLIIVLELYYPDNCGSYVMKRTSPLQ